MNFDHEPQIEKPHSYEYQFLATLPGDYYENLKAWAVENPSKNLVMIFRANPFTSEEISAQITEMMTLGFDFSTAYVLSMLAHNNQSIPSHLQPKDRNYDLYISGDVIDPLTGEIASSVTENINPWYMNQRLERFALGQSESTGVPRPKPHKTYLEIEQISSEVSLNSLQMHRDIKNALAEIGWSGNLTYVLLPTENAAFFPVDSVYEFEDELLRAMAKPWGENEYLSLYANKLIDIARQLAEFRNTIDSRINQRDIPTSPDTKFILHCDAFAERVWDTIGNEIDVERIVGESLNAWVLRRMLRFANEDGEINEALINEIDWDRLAIQHFISNCILVRDMDTVIDHSDKEKFNAYYRKIQEEEEVIMLTIEGRLTELLELAKTDGLLKAITKVLGVNPLKQSSLAEV